MEPEQANSLTPEAAADDDDDDDNKDFDSIAIFVRKRYDTVLSIFLKNLLK